MLPPLQAKVEDMLLDFAPTHAASYNSFVDIVRFNLMTADWWGPAGEPAQVFAKKKC
jgi:hypothetical protein